MPAYCIRYKSDGVETGVERFFDQDSFQAILLAQRHVAAQGHTEFAELWTDGIYVTTLCLGAGGEFWQVYREPDVVARSDALNARLVARPFFFNPPENRRREQAAHHHAQGNVHALVATAS